MQMRSVPSKVRKLSSLDLDSVLWGTVRRSRTSVLVRLFPLRRPEKGSAWISLRGDRVEIIHFEDLCRLGTSLSEARILEQGVNYPCRI